MVESFARLKSQDKKAHARRKLDIATVLECLQMFAMYLVGNALSP